MKIRHWLLYVGLSLVVCLGPVSMLRAQEQKPEATETLPQIIKRIRRSSVFIITYDKYGIPLIQGSGFFVGDSGNIITNRHILEGAIRAEIKTAQGKVHPITHILAEDKEGDLVLASVDIPPSSVQPLKLSDSIPRLGDKIVVIGNPLGLEGAVSNGGVSAVRDIPSFGRIIQISAPIYPGSSGSPVVDMKGRVIGIATFQILIGQTFNFAIPSQRAVKLKPGKPRSLAQWQKPPVEEHLTSAERDYVRGICHLWIEYYQQALPFFEKAVEKNPQYAEAVFQIGYCQGKLGQHSEAIAGYKRAIRIKPDLFDAYNNLGATYGKLGRYAEAVAACKQAIHIKPEHVEAHNNLGNAHAALLRYPEAIASYKQAIRINPDYAEAHNNLATAYSILGRFNEAVASFKEAVRIKPDYAKAHFNLAVMYMCTGNRASALEEYKILKNLDKDLANKLLGFINK